MAARPLGRGHGRQARWIVGESTVDGENTVEFDAVIFDLDGTLADTLEDIADAMNRVLRRRALPAHDYGSYRLMIGKGLRNLVGEALPSEMRSEATIAACLEQMMAEYGEHCLVKTHLYDGIAELVGALRADGVRLAVLSNKADELTQRIVGALFAAGTFDSGRRRPTGPAAQARPRGGATHRREARRAAGTDRLRRRLGGRHAHRHRGGHGGRRRVVGLPING